MSADGAMIVPQSSGCVGHALSVMRLALGYADGVPEELRADAGGGKSDMWILEHGPQWFPRHEVRVWCNPQCARAANDTSAFAGDIIGPDLDFDAWLMAWGYDTDMGDDSDSHFVIGAPDFRQVVTVVVGVRIGGES